MITVSNIRIEEHSNTVRLVCDVTSNIEYKVLDLNNKTMWFEVPIENKNMFNTQVYDPFFLVPLYLAMFFHTNLKICGKMSKKLYFNTINYIQKILCNFSNHLGKIEIEVDGFSTVSSDDSKLVGTGISCGIDSLSTIYDHFVIESDMEYRINSLFLFNCGTHGPFDSPKTSRVFEARYQLNKTAAEDLRLPIYVVNSNLHEFRNETIDKNFEKSTFFALYSCVLALQGSISKYYVSSACEYNDILTYGLSYQNIDVAGFSESYLIPLIQTETLSLIIDGCQYKRSEKTERIADWQIAQKHLNVCVNTDNHAHNCSYCSKCIRTLMILDAMGKINKFEQVFDLDTYYKKKELNMMEITLKNGKDCFSTDIYNYANAHGMKMPSKKEAYRYFSKQRQLSMTERIQEFYWKFRGLIGRVKRAVLSNNV